MWIKTAGSPLRITAHYHQPVLWWEMCWMVLSAKRFICSPEVVLWIGLPTSSCRGWLGLLCQADMCGLILSLWNRSADHSFCLASQYSGSVGLIYLSLLLSLIGVWMLRGFLSIRRQAETKENVWHKAWMGKMPSLRSIWEGLPMVSWHCYTFTDVQLQWRVSGMPLNAFSHTKP